MANEITSLDLLITRGRGMGISFIVVEQLPSRTSKETRVSAHLIVAFNTAGPEIRTTAELLGFNSKDEVEELRTLGKGECIVSPPGDRCAIPLRLQFALPAIDRKNLTAQERIDHIARSLKDLLPDTQPRFSGFIEQRQETKQRERDPNRLSIRAWKVFVRIAGYTDETIDERCAVLNLNKAEEGSARKESVGKGYLTRAGSLGQNITLFELTPKGRAFADQHNIPVRKYQSGLVHETILRRVMKGLSKACSQLKWTNPSGATGSIQPDAYGLLPDGWAICVQVHFRNKLEYEVGKLMDLCRIDHVDMVLLVAATKKATEAVMAEIAKSWRKDVPQRYQLISATECLKPDFDWTDALSKPTS